MELKVDGESLSKTKNEKIDLVQLIKSDPELRDFFRMVYENDLREKAVEALRRQINRAHLKVIQH